LVTIGSRTVAALSIIFHDAQNLRMISAFSSCESVVVVFFSAVSGSLVVKAKGCRSIQPVLDRYVGEGLKIVVGAEHRGLHGASQRRKYHVNLGQNAAICAEIMKDLGVERSERRFQGPNTDLAQENGENALVLITAPRVVKTSLQLAEYRHACAESVPPSSGLYQSFLNERPIV
jgi:hypothetical protein